MSEEAEMRAAVEVALRSLSEELRSVLILRDVEGYSFADIARQSGMPESTLRRQHKEAVLQLRQIFRDRGHNESEAQADPDPGTAALELAAEDKATVSETTILKPEEVRLTPSVLICDPRVLQYLDANPEKMRDLSPREFETLIAGLLDKFGYTVELGPLGADGGVDVHATKPSPTGLEYLVVQCKRYSEGNKVSAPVVKQLWADVLHRGATRGLVVTTSWFTREALKYVSLHKHQLDAADFDRIKEWLRLLSKRAA